MLLTITLVTILLITADFWLNFFMGAGVNSFWTAVSLLIAGIIVGLYQNQFLILIPVLFLISVYTYAIACYHLIDRPRMAQTRRQHAGF